MRPPKSKSGGHVGRSKKMPNQRDAESSDENEDDATAFRSPSGDEDVTDYGLEFTTSRLTLTDRNGQPRNSTLRSKNQTSAAAQSQHESRDAPTDYEDDDDDDEDEGTDDEENVENQPPSTPLRSRPQSSGPTTASGRPSHNRSKPQSQPQTRPPVPASRNRKQVRPTNRATLMNRQIRRIQKSVDTLIPRLPFSRLVREILHYNNSGTGVFRVTSSALDALQQSSEMFLTQRFQDSYLLTMHRQRVTLEVRDMALMAFFCKESVI